MATVFTITAAATNLRIDALRDDLNIGSLDLIALAADLEDELEINIRDDVLSRIRTIGDLFQAIDDTKAGAA